MLKKGDTVVMHTCGEAEHYDGQLWVCSSNEFASSSGTQVVFLEGFSGYFMVNYLQKVKLEQETNIPKPVEEWHEDVGECLWWHFPIVEPPYCGIPLDIDFPDYVTHFTKVIIPMEP